MDGLAPVPRDSGAPDTGPLVVVEVVSTVSGHVTLKDWAVTWLDNERTKERASTGKDTRTFFIPCSDEIGTVDRFQVYCGNGKDRARMRTSTQGPMALGESAVDDRGRESGGNRTHREQRLLNEKDTQRVEELRTETKESGAVEEISPGDGGMEASLTYLF